ncbi:MAG: cytochrome P450 [Mycetocola sp.]
MSVVSAESSAVDLAARLFSLDQELLDDSYPVYARLRDEAAVMRWGSIVAVACYDDVKDDLRDVTNLSSVRTVGSRHQARLKALTPAQAEKMRELMATEDRWLVQSDDPFHAGVRRFVNHAFSAAAIGEMRDDIVAITDELLDEAEGRDGSRLELVNDLAYRLPLRAVCVLLGADPQDEEKIRQWFDAIGEGLGTTYANVDEAHAALENFRAYVRAMIHKGREGVGQTNLFASLVSTADDGTSLDEEDLVAMFVLLLFAGHEATTNLISNAVVPLLQNPDQLEVLRTSPDLIRGSVDEFLRYCTSVHAVHRVAAKDAEIAGFEVKEGETIRLLLGSANHDPAKFDDPARLDVTRKSAKQHVGLGYGIHTCLGMWLVRLEVEVALGALLSRYEQLEIVGSTAVRPNFTLRGPERVDLAYVRANAPQHI